jgi:putative GTP pyrophosphokinase
MTEPPAPSKSSVRRAGSTIRKYRAGECGAEDFEAAITVMVAFRSQFTEPLLAVNRRIRDIGIRNGLPSEVTQRLKKSATILNKLSREPGLDLSRMQDIGGCRVVVPSLENLRQFQHKVEAEWAGFLHHIKDYVEEPRASGYRAVHVIVVQDERQIEIQLRTEPMHSWAETVEAFSGVVGTNFKQDGSHVVQEFMQVMSQMMAAAEAGTTLDEAVIDKLTTLRTEVTAYLKPSSEA